LGDRDDVTKGDTKPQRFCAHLVASSHGHATEPSYLRAQHIEIRKAR
jgi:hypothetical protein